ncbi:MAG: hypothetical protein M0C28_18400 [Candidatus Moduliflexus flocculans]|nr:hypothetical protein [Candidatus Moduliflexus flocculans]
MNQKKLSLPTIIVIVSAIVFVLSIVSLAFGDFLADTFDVIGIRIAMLVVAFASFCSSSLFSMMIYQHNRTVSRINDDTNRRAELFREQTFASSNYSIIEFIDRMLIYDESDALRGPLRRAEDDGFPHARRPHRSLRSLPQRRADTASPR